MADGTAAAAPPSYTFGVRWPDLNDGLRYTDIVKHANPAPSLIQLYSKYANSAPLQGWLQRIRKGQVTVDGQVVTDPETVLRIGSEVVYHRLPWEEPYAPYLLEVLFEDDDIVALNKPSGLQVLPGGLFQQRTILTQLQWRAHEKNSLSCKFRISATEEAHPVPVHRLGRGTSGVLLCAKTKHAKTCLASHFAHGTSVVTDTRNCDMELNTMRKISKLYRALVMGLLDVDEVVVNQPIGMMHYPGVAKGLYVASASGKQALSKVNVLERNVRQNQTLVQVEIQSGRPHQIRIHLAFIGHPLVGDPLYVIGGLPNCMQSESKDDSFAEDGGFHRPTKPVPGDCGYHLHAHRLLLHHPSKNEKIEITAPLPPVLQSREELGHMMPEQKIFVTADTVCTAIGEPRAT